jgi:predicted ATPase/class 3 adenylate cyclase
MITGMVRRDLPSGAVTFLFTDVEGSTKLLHELGAEAYTEILAEHRRVVREACTARGGVEVDTQGDAFFVAFPTAVEALEAAEAITERMASGPIALRIGLHTGTPLLTEEGYVGEDVHFGARVAASAHGGQVVFSQATRGLLDEGYPLRELGEHRLKDIPEPVAIFQLGDGQFPPLKTISNTNLPRSASSFVGREQELSELLARIEDGGRLVTLTGPGGSGKTRLALEAAATLVPEYQAGVFWVGLAALRDPAFVTETIAQTLGAKDGLAEHIGEREMLLLLDNLEQVIEAAPELSELLTSCRNLTLLVTSRELLRVQGEVEYPVPPLAEAEAVSLFCERAQTEASEEIAELCQRLDNLPLAVELAAARTKALSPGQILARLSYRLDLLKGGRDADPRQQTLRATVEWSHELLSPEEQQLFARLYVFAGGCTLDAAEELCNADLDTLQSLVEKSLIRFSNERYWMLETIREYAGKHFKESGEAEQLRQRHAEWLLALVEETEPNLMGAQRPALQRLDDEHNNVRSALTWLREAGESAFELRLTGAFWRFWYLRGLWNEGRDRLEQALAGDSMQPALLREKVLYGAALLAHRQGDYDRAEVLTAERLNICRELGDPQCVSSCLLGLGLMATAKEDYERATVLIEESADLAREQDDKSNLAMATNNLGDLALLRGDYHQAAAHFEESLALARELSDMHLVAAVLANLGFGALEQGHHDKARAWLSESLTVSQELGNLEVVVWCVEGIAAVEASEKAERAATLLGAAESLREQMGAVPRPSDRQQNERTLALLQSKLGEELYVAAWARGQAMTLDETVTYALSSVD